MPDSKMNMHFIQKTSVPGELLLEVVIAIMLLAVLASSLFVLMSSQILRSGQSRGTEEALTLAEEGIAASKSIRDVSWDALTVGQHGISLQNNAYQFLGTQDITNGTYSRTVTVTEISPAERKVNVVVNWLSSGQRARSITLSTVLTTWRTARPAGGTEVVWGDWGNPIVVGSVDLDAGNEGTGIDVKNKIVYVTTKASQAAKKDFYVIDSTTSTNPIIKGSINTGAGLLDVAVTGTYAFAIADYDITQHNNSELQVIDISSPTNPILRTRYTFTGAFQHPIVIKIKGRYAYLGGDRHENEADDHEEFAIVDIQNPLAPVLKGSMHVDGNVNDIVFKGNYAYLATTKDTAEVTVADIIDPLHPSIAKELDLTSNYNANGIYFHATNTRAYVVRDAGGTNAMELGVLNTATIDNPTDLGGADNNNSLLEVIQSGTLIFLSVDVANLEFQVYKLGSANTPVYYSGLNFPQVVKDMVLENNFIYVAVRSNDALKIITSQ